VREMGVTNEQIRTITVTKLRSFSRAVDPQRNSPSKTTAVLRADFLLIGNIC
jgi:hypothetical protein